MKIEAERDLANNRVAGHDLRDDGHELIQVNGRALGRALSKQIPHSPDHVTGTRRVLGDIANDLLQLDAASALSRFEQVTGRLGVG